MPVGGCRGDGLPEELAARTSFTTNQDGPEPAMLTVLLTSTSARDTVLATSIYKTDADIAMSTSMHAA